jgi:hypothetical protein
VQIGYNKSTQQWTLFIATTAPEATKKIFSEAYLRPARRHRSPISKAACGPVTMQFDTTALPWRSSCHGPRVCGSRTVLKRDGRRRQRHAVTCSLPAAQAPATRPISFIGIRATVLCSRAQRSRSRGDMAQPWERCRTADSVVTADHDVDGFLICLSPMA